VFCSKGKFVPLKLGSLGWRVVYCGRYGRAEFAPLGINDLGEVTNLKLRANLTTGS
jgi:hypothetical protein